MRPDPSQRLDPKAILQWRIRGLFPGLLFATIAAVATFSITTEFGQTALAAAAAYIIPTVFFSGIRPTFLGRTWRYEITRDELYIQRGFLVVTRTVIPLVRIENVDTIQGPLGSMLGVMAVTVSTAAGSHVIPSLSVEVAESLRDQIARWAREAKDD